MHSTHSPETSYVSATDHDTGIIVTPADMSLWLRALERAEAEQLTAIRTGGSRDDFPSEKHVYKVRSGKNTYIVVVTRFSSPVDGLTTVVRCDCTAAKNDKVCKHAALATRLANCFPFSVRTHAPTSQETINLLLAPKWRR